ncbi:MAG: hypothetical protein KGQ77_01705, partial [Betaproteobacteria bacterium]|nr:hypothetical protein [Betaproteobacteria bacterium]
APLAVQWRDAHVAPLLTGDVPGSMQAMLLETLGSSMVEVDVLTLCGVDAWCTFARRATTLRTRVQAAITALRSPRAALDAVLDHLAPQVPA